MKARFIALTDINRGIEQDDIQSLVRLLLYSNQIDIEGLIACTSCFVKRGARRKHLKIIHDVIDAYEKVRANLLLHEPGFPEADALRVVACTGVPAFGKSEGNGFADAAYDGCPGVKRILDAADREDPRPLWIGLWGGANTLAQAVWTARRQRSDEAFDRFLSKLRIYGISDQDHAAPWLRARFGEKLFYIVSPSCADRSGARDYWRATWPGISADRNRNGSEDGSKGGGFSGADGEMVGNAWLGKNIISHGVYGKAYPRSRFIMEGDTPSYLGLIPNGLNEPEHPDYGGWGGRYERRVPSATPGLLPENHPIWTNAADTVTGSDGRLHTSPQATIWRWRAAYQNDFAARMDWTVARAYAGANHPQQVRFAHPVRLEAAAGAPVELDASPSFDPDGDALSFHWFFYREAGSPGVTLSLENSDSSRARFVAPDIPPEAETLSLHILVEVRDGGTPVLTRYGRVVVDIVKTARASVCGNE